MAPQPLTDLRNYVERVQSTLTDPAERDRALAVCERDLTDLLGMVTTYRKDAQLSMEPTDGEAEGDDQPA